MALNQLFVFISEGASLSRVPNVLRHFSKKLSSLREPDCNLLLYHIGTFLNALPHDLVPLV